jgi:hypothetical protein
MLAAIGVAHRQDELPAYAPAQFPEMCNARLEIMEVIDNALFNFDAFRTCVMFYGLKNECSSISVAE